MESKEMLEILKEICEGDERKSNGNTFICLCTNCPIKKVIGHDTCNFTSYYKHYDEVVKVCEQWRVDHPKKTYLDVLLEKFPNAKFNEGKYNPLVCVQHLFKSDTYDCTEGVKSCAECWNRIYKGEE